MTDTQNAPERIWIIPSDESWDNGHWNSDPGIELDPTELSELTTEYTRTDLCHPVKVKPLDLSNLLKHAFINGRDSVPFIDTTLNATSDAWVEYDPTENETYQRILAALEPAPMSDGWQHDKIIEIMQEYLSIEYDYHYPTIVGWDDAAEEILTAAPGETVDPERGVPCKRKLAEGQWFKYCGETDMGQTAPALCEVCGGEFKLAASGETNTGCRKCGGDMKPGQGLAQTLTGVPDFDDGEVSTLSPGGPGKMIDCMKCQDCGWSVTNTGNPVDPVQDAPQKWEFSTPYKLVREDTTLSGVHYQLLHGGIFVASYAVRHWGSEHACIEAAWRYAYESDEPEMSVQDAAKVLLARMPNYAMERAAIESVAHDDEGEFPSLGDLLDFSGENKTHTVVREAINAVLRALAAKEGDG